MTLPSFLGIGGERCGSTWLHLLLQDHPQIYVPTQRKELDFFNLNYDKGLDWYESFFPDSTAAQVYTAIGEISPRYLNFPHYAKRLTTIPSLTHLIVILRNPIDRAYSHYGHTVRLRGYSKTFEDFLLDYPQAITHGFYAAHLQPFLHYYQRHQLCHLLFEEAIVDLSVTKQRLAQFLNVAVDRFPVTAGTTKANETYVPKLKRLNRLANWTRGRLRKVNLDGVINVAKAAGLQDLLKWGADRTLPPMQPTTRSRLQETFAEDIKQLEGLLEVDLQRWQS